MIRYFDLNNDDKVSMEEFKATLRSGVYQEMQKLKQATGAVEATSEERIVEICKFIADHLQKGNDNLLSFTNSLNPKERDNITPEVLTEFFKKIGVQLLPKERDALFEKIDPRRTGRCTVKQFIDVVGPYVKEKPMVTDGIEKALNKLASYVVEKHSDAQTFFNRIDDNKNGFIEKKELHAELNKIGHVTSDIEMANVASYFDESKDGRINLKEFLKQMEPYIITAKRQNLLKAKEVQNSTDNKMLGDLKFKCRNVMRAHYQDVAQGFDIMKQFNKNGDSLISKEDFKSVLQRNQLGFTPLEIDLVADSLTQLNIDGYIHYDRFLRDHCQSEAQVNLSQSQISASSQKTEKLLQLNTAEEVIKRLANVLKKNKIDPQKAFAAFDKDGNGKISIQEFK